VKRMVRPSWTYVVPEITVDYWRFVMHTLAEVPAGMYGMDQRRAEMHAALCQHYGLTHEQTKEVTDHMDKLRLHDGGCSTALHEALQNLWDKYPLPNARLDRQEEAKHDA
jgi:hypothetical protein